MAEIVLYTHNKRINSTKRPTGGTPLTVYLKDRCGIINPQFTVSGNYVRNFNYAKWEDRYYWIDEITQENNSYWTISCSIDALATLKSAIQGTSAYVMYAASGFDLKILDPRQVPTVDITSQVTKAEIGGFTSNGTYYLSTVGANQTSNNFCNFYGMTGDSLSQVASVLTSDTAIMTEFKEYFASALECAVSCHWLPISTATSGTTVKLGNFDTGISAGMVTTNYYYTLVTLEPPWHGNYLDSDTYTKLTLYLPFVGAVELGAGDFLREPIIVHVCVDIKSGGISYAILRGGSTEIVATYSGNCMTKLPISTYKQDVGAVVNGALGVVQSIGSTGASLASLTSPQGILNLGDTIGGVVNGVMQGVSSAVNTGMAAMTRTPSMSGGMTGLSCIGFPFSTSVILVTQQKGYSDPITAKASVCGLPVMETRNLSGFSGFVQTAGASVSADMPRAVINAVNAALDGGIYIE